MMNAWASSTIGPITRRLLGPSRLLVNASCRALSSENIDDIPGGQSSARSSDIPEGGEKFYNQTGRVMEWKKGDWLCDSCGNHVFAFRHACPRCNTVKHHHDDVSDIDSQVQPSRTVGWADAYTHVPKQSAKSSRHKPGDWDCPACEFHNFASRHVCFRCKEARPHGVVYVSGGRGIASAFPELYKPGDWECPSCKAHNYASRLACFRCRLPKTHDARVFGGDPDRSVAYMEISQDLSYSTEDLSTVESEEESSTTAASFVEMEQNHHERW